MIQRTLIVTFVVDVVLVQLQQRLQSVRDAVHRRASVALASEIAHVLRAKLLSAQVSRDLAVWDYGVTSTEDLGSLNLDIDKPESIPGALQPLMVKQFDQRVTPK